MAIDRLNNTNYAHSMQQQTNPINVTSRALKSSLSSERLSGLQDVADRLGVSVWTIRRWVQIGKVSSVRLGRRRLISETEIQRLIADGLR